LRRGLGDGSTAQGRRQVAHGTLKVGYDEYYNKITLVQGCVLHVESEIVTVFSVIVPVFVYDDIEDENAENENEKKPLTPADSLVTVMTHRICLFGSL
jgi:hypothetical protein